MPRIKLTSIVAGPDYRGQPGEIIEVSHQHAHQLITARAALPLEPLGPEDAPSKTAAKENASNPPPPPVDSKPGENAESPAAPGTAAKTGRARKSK